MFEKQNGGGGKGHGSSSIWQPRVPAIERQTMGKVYWRILPIALVTYFLCYLDRINVGFAALTMNKELGLDSAIYGMAAGAFFWGYVLFEVPSNIVLEKVGARLWIARIMLSWGLLSGLTAFCVGPWSFTACGLCWALPRPGCFPASSSTSPFGSPTGIAAASWRGSPWRCRWRWRRARRCRRELLELDGLLGLAGWKWMFIAEAVPTLLIGVVVLFYLTDRSEARWLSDDERAWLCTEIDCERQASRDPRQGEHRALVLGPEGAAARAQLFRHRRPSLGLLLFLPQMVKELRFTNMQVGWVTMVPYLFGALSMAVWGWVSDRMGERRWNLFWACLLAALGLAIAGATTGTYWSLVGMTIATIGLYGTKGRSGRCRRCS